MIWDEKKHEEYIKNEEAEDLTDEQAIELGILTKDTTLVLAKDIVYDDQYLKTRNQKYPLLIKELSMIPFTDKEYNIQSGSINKGNVIDLQNPSSLPDPTHIKYIEEPWIRSTIITPDEYLGSIIKLCQDKRGIQTNLSYSGNRAVLNYELPLNEVVFDFNDRLKSMTSGYASFDYEIIEHREGDLVKLGILVNSESVDALSMMVHKNFAQSIGREVCEKLKDLIPRHNFMIPVQAAIGGKIIARETIKGFKKDVLTKIHGGGARDRKRKLLDKQKKGKTRSKQFGRVEIPQEAFIGVLKINKEK